MDLGQVIYVLLLLFAVIGLSARVAQACACGCSVFDVGTPSLLPDGTGWNGVVGGGLYESIC